MVLDYVGRSGKYLGLCLEQELSMEKQEIMYVPPDLVEDIECEILDSIGRAILMD